MTLLQQLRAATSEQHRHLEDGLDVLARCADAASYRALLSLLYGVHGALEPALTRARPPLTDWPSRRRLHHLVADLAELGVDAGALPVTDRLPDLSTPARVVGCLYVVEGATLGGAHIARAARPLPVRFLDAYGAERGGMWRAFRAQAQGWAEHADDAVAAAQETFDVFGAWCLGVRA